MMLQGSISAATKILPNDSSPLPWGTLLRLWLQGTRILNFQKQYQQQWQCIHICPPTSLTLTARSWQWCTCSCSCRHQLLILAMMWILILMVQVIDYQSRLDRDFTTRSYISQTRYEDLRLWGCGLHTLKVWECEECVCGGWRWNTGVIETRIIRGVGALPAFHCIEWQCHDVQNATRACNESQALKRTN